MTDKESHIIESHMHPDFPREEHRIITTDSQIAEPLICKFAAQTPSQQYH